MLSSSSRPQTAPAKSARSSEKTTPLTTLEVRRLKRLKEIEHMLKRKDMLRASPSGLYQPWSASGELPRGRRNLLPQQPAPIPPLNPRVVQQELVKARRRASRLGEWETLNRLRTLYPDEFAFYPRTWTLPAQLGEFRQHCVDRAAAGSTDDVYIAKPSGGCQGAGI